MAAQQGETQGWARRLAGYAWRHRKDAVLALGSSLAGMAVMALVPLATKVIIDDVIVGHTRDMAPWAGALIAAAVLVYVLTYIRRYYGGRLALDVQHDLRTEMFGTITAARRAPAGRAVDRAGRRPGHQRPPADPGPALHAPDDDREPGALRDLPGDHGLAVPAAHPGRPGRGPRPVVDRQAQPQQAARPAILVRPVPRSRSTSRASGVLSTARRRRGTGAEGLRAGATRRPGSSGRSAGGPSPAGCAPSASPPRTPRPSRPSPPSVQVAMLALGGWLAVRRAHHARHVRRLLHLPRPARRPGPHARHGANRSATQAAGRAPERVLALIDREVRLRGRALRLRRRGRGPRRHRPAYPGRPDGRVRRRDGRRQVDPGQAGRPLLRPDRRPGAPSTARTSARWTSPPIGTASASSRRRRTSSRAPSVTPSPTAARTPPTPRWRRRPVRSAPTR
ncbi:hypothetical protein SALBM311S_12210 [Streptomyces alboniger]